MADGPLRFIGSLDGKDMNIENVSKFGRDFSVVCVPYTLKLLIQELQTINIQMRLITEDNIEQLENLSYSKNIEVLMNKTGITAKDIINGINKDIRAETEKAGIFAKPTSISTPTPVEEVKTERIPRNIEEEYGFFETGNTPAASPSPTYPEGVSPAYQPSDSEWVSSVTSSPGYNPDGSPIIYSPHSPTSPPPPGMKGGSRSGSILDVLSEQAQTFKIGEPVLYRGGGEKDARRLWTVTHIGDKFIKIEPQTMDGLYHDDDVKIVTAMDIYRPNDFSYAEQDPFVKVPMMDPVHQMGMPGIHFAPVIKITGGNDFSTEPTASAEVSPNEPIRNDFINQMGLISGVKKEKEKEHDDDSGKIDFTKLVVKKL